MEVTAESNDSFLAFRRLMYSLSQKLTSEDIRAIGFICFCNRQDYYNANPLDVLCKLELEGVVTYHNPEKLLELLKDLKRHDLVGEVKDYIKRKKSKHSDKKFSTLKKKVSNGGKIASKVEVETASDLELKSMLEAALVQATVLLQQIEKLQISTSGNTFTWSAVKHIVSEAAQTSEALAERLRKAELRGHLDTKQREFEGFGGYRDPKSPEQNSKGYINTAHSGEEAISV